MESPVYPVSDSSPPVNREWALGIIATVSVLALLYLALLLQPESVVDGVRGADKAASSLGDAVQICLDLHRKPTPS